MRTVNSAIYATSRKERSGFLDGGANFSRKTLTFFVTAFTDTTAQRAPPSVFTLQVR
jgi:hypothetical protein